MALYHALFTDVGRMLEAEERRYNATLAQAHLGGSRPAKGVKNTLDGNQPRHYSWLVQSTSTAYSVCELRWSCRVSSTIDTFIALHHVVRTLRKP
jgi:hypothetical protein